MTGVGKEGLLSIPEVMDRVRKAEEEAEDLLADARRREKEIVADARRQRLSLLEEAKLNARADIAELETSEKARVEDLLRKLDAQGLEAQKRLRERADANAAAALTAALGALKNTLRRV